MPYAPQIEVLKHCSLTLTHAGLNTVLDSLSQGVPAIAVPLTYEQPAIGARLVWTGAGTVIEPGKLNKETLRRRILETLASERQRSAAASLAASMRAAGGVQRAADIISKALQLPLP